MSAPDQSRIARSSLDALLRPRRLAMIGASDKNHFSRRAFAQSRRFARGQDLPLVNPRSPIVHGRPTVGSCTEIEGGIDCAFLLTPQSATPAALNDAVSAGARAGIVLSAGWGESGAEGAARQRELVDQARASGVVLLGPNHLGFANLWDGIAPCGLGLDLPVDPGAVALVSQSGAVGSSLVGYAARHDIRFSFVVTTGNEAMVTVADIVDYLVDDEHTKAIAVFAETVRRPEVFRDAARRAADLGKAIVILKAGASELAARTAAAHTGALVGDDRVIDAVLKQDGVIRVDSVEALLGTAALCAAVGPLRAPGIGLMSISGGACDLIADQGQPAGLVFPPLSATAEQEFRDLLPPYASPQNPLDVTGGSVTTPHVWSRGIRILDREPEIGIVGVVTSLPRDSEPQRDDVFRAVGEACAATGLPAVIFPQIDEEPSDHVRSITAEAGVPQVMSGLDRFVDAAAGLTWWSAWLLERRRAEQPGPVPSIALPDAGPLSEYAARLLCEEAGVPLVPARLVTSVSEAQSAAAEFGDAVVLKMCSPAAAHKTELGGVELDVRGAEAVAAAYERLVARAESAAVPLDGILVSPMRRGGIELLVGVTRDDDWGHVLAIAAGGALVELLDDSVIRVLPVDDREIRAMLDGLKTARLLNGFRGSEPADPDAVTAAIRRIVHLAQALPDDIESVEVNPLLVHGSRVEGLDALITRQAPTIDRDAQLKE